MTEQITCFLCGREYAKDRAAHIERGHYVCGPPRHCREYAHTPAARQLIRDPRPLWQRDRQAYEAQRREAP